MRKDPETVTDANRTTTVEMTGSDPEQVIADVLGDVPRAAYWRELREALSDRLVAAKSERDRWLPDTAERTAVEKRIAELREQVHALATEEAVTQFVEDSIRASLNRPVPAGTFAFADDEFAEEF
ncbi:MAG: hypothetical protein SFU56_19015 [Capsulimonadales bacterium]|nr:hypothetical protein [Capsulimonadales bacterium]